MPCERRLFCFGLGYVAQTLGRRLQGDGWQVAGTTRSPQRRADLERAGFEAHLLDDERPLASYAEAVGGARAVLVSAPPGAEGDPVLRQCRDALRRTPPRWIGYLSSTAVYGDRGGEWVSEEDPPAPTGPRGRRRLAAEAEWLALARGPDALPVHVFRLAGIYGPGRSALERVRAGAARRFEAPGHVFSRIHVEDAATVLQASLAAPAPGRIYNLADDRPTPQAEVIELACALLGVAPPPLEPLDGTVAPALAEFFADRKRVRNARIKQELGVTLRYPDVAAGLRALV